MNGKLPRDCHCEHVVHQPVEVACLALAADDHVAGIALVWCCDDAASISFGDGIDCLGADLRLDSVLPHSLLLTGGVSLVVDSDDAVEVAQPEIVDGSERAIAE